MFVLTLSDIDECASSDTNDCHPDASCNNTVGSFDCTCLSGFEGNGTFCNGNLNNARRVSDDICGLLQLCTQTLMSVVLEFTHALMLTVSILMEVSIVHLVILVSLVMECHAVSYLNNVLIL